ncbi:hypothetical protein CDL15_Pgr012260 [Punica granatum]|uniref:Uncharacterized protein n=1 Tax=Punica granatum TaxID=22663 RepID=A0A218WSG7_PUNGR|nr:hypothetical protein CDL15_Pgr012260 [Punica granatum]
MVANNPLLITKPQATTVLLTNSHRLTPVPHRSSPPLLKEILRLKESCWRASSPLPETRDWVRTTLHQYKQMDLKYALGSPQGSQISSVEREWPQAQFECKESPEKFHKDERNKGGKRLEGLSLCEGDSTVPLKVEMIVEELNKLIENQIAENEKKKKQGIVLFNMDDKSSLAKVHHHTVKCQFRMLRS